MKQLLPLICLLLATCMESVEAQQHIDLSGKWHFGTGAKATYDGFVSLPGSMQTNGKGEKVTALVGVLNVHWGEKGYAMASEWREFWVYPDIQEEQATQGLHIADTLDAKALEVRVDANAVHLAERLAELQETKTHKRHLKRN